jgi:hypothetical protein
MTPRKRKWIHAGLVALVSGFADIGAQLASGQLVNAPRAVIVGVGVGLLARAVGAMLAAQALDEADAEGSSDAGPGGG